jgi:hypothetical protein
MIICVFILIDVRKDLNEAYFLLDDIYFYYYIYIDIFDDYREKKEVSIWQTVICVRFFKASRDSDASRTYRKFIMYHNETFTLYKYYKCFGWNRNYDYIFSIYNRVRWLKKIPCLCIIAI